jgi:TonB-linked SusC/RagA family outer membrane protein
MRRCLLFASLSAVLSVPVLRAQGSIAGTVRDAATSAPLARATVTVVGTRLSAETDAEGRYAVSGVPPGTYALRARLLGYGPGVGAVVVQDGQEAVADFGLKASPIELNPVVAIGYGEQRKSDLTGSMSSIQGEAIATSPVANAQEAIAGRVPGVQVQTTNAEPGSELRIRVRGGNSLEGNNAPLVVVDGVIGADLDQINTGDIESLNILKDASATAIYGARAANGVILVTTKRGQPGQMRFAYSGYTGMQEVSKYIDVLNADEFARLFMRNPNHPTSITFDTLNPLPSTNWQRVIYRTAAIRNQEVTVSGTNGGTNLLVSGSWFDQQGVVLGSGLQRGSLRLNLDQNVAERFRFGTRVTYSRSVGNEVRVNDGYGSAGGPLTTNTLTYAPTIPVYDSTGNFSGPLLPGLVDNPLAIIKRRQDKTTTDYLLSSVFGEYDLMPGLTWRTNAAYTYRHGLHQQYQSRLLAAVLNSGQANIDNSAAITWLLENTATLHRTVGEKHDVTLLGGFTAQQTRNTANTEQGRGFASDLLGYRRLNLADTVTGASSASRTRVASFLGRANYSFAGKYLLTATFRVDGSSKFAANNKWASFPSAAVAWRLSEEPFFQRLAPGVNDLKLRFSAGRTGSEAIGAYQSLGAWSIGGIYAIGKTTFRNGATPSRNANPNLRWETTTQYDAGLDLALFDHRLNLTVDAYHKTTYDLLYGKQVPYITGFEDYVTNIGKVQNRGLEIELDTRHEAGAFTVNLGGTLSLNRNKVLDLGGDKEFFLAGANGSLPLIRAGAIVRVGEPLGNIYGYVWDGIFQNAAEVAAAHQVGAVVGGDKLRDLDHNDSLTTDGRDLTILGNAQPRYLVGQTGSLRYRALSVSWVLRAALDFQVVNLNRLGMSTPGNNTNTLRSTLDYWTPTNPTNTMTGLGIPPNSNLTSRWVEEGSFIRLQNVTAEWTLPRQLGGRLGMGDLRVYVSAQNLFTLTRYSWYDPEVNSRGTNDRELGWDDASYPGVRTVTFGIHASF